MTYCDYKGIQTTHEEEEGGGILPVYFMNATDFYIRKGTVCSVILSYDDNALILEA